MQGVVSLARMALADLMAETVATEVSSAVSELQVSLRSSVVTEAQFNAAVAELESYQTNMKLNIDRRGACPGLSVFNTLGYPSTGSDMGTVVPPDVVWQAGIGVTLPYIASPAAYMRWVLHFSTIW